jgi:hypothetical protein
LIQNLYLIFPTRRNLSPLCAAATAVGTHFAAADFLENQLDRGEPSTTMAAASRFEAADLSCSNTVRWLTLAKNLPS